jgi:hypothetical protein
MAATALLLVRDFERRTRPIRLTTLMSVALDLSFGRKIAQKTIEAKRITVRSSLWQARIR